MRSKTRVSACVVVSICIAMVIDGSIVLYGCLLWPKTDTDSPLFITGVATFLVCFTLPFILLGVFLLYNLCQRECFQYQRAKLDLLPPSFLQTFEDSSTESIDSLFYRPEFQLDEEPIKTFGVEEYISTKYFTPFDHTSLDNEQPNPRMGCTIVTKLSNAKPGSTGNGSLQSVKSCSGTDAPDGLPYLTDLTENHYIRGVSPAPLPPVRFRTTQITTSVALASRFIKMSGSTFVLDPVQVSGGEDSITSPFV